MNRITASILAACLSLGTAAAYAQDTSMKADAKATNAATDCKDHANTATGQKRTDPATPDAGTGCASAPKMKKHSMKKSMMKKDSDSDVSTPASRTN